MSTFDRKWDKAQFDSNMAKLPEKAYSKNRWHCAGPNGEPPVICLKKGEEGFYPIYTDRTAEQLNEVIGVTEAQAKAMVNGSLFGWDTPGADPDNSINQKKEA